MTARDGLHAGMAAVAPSGEQVEIALGDRRAVVVEVGGGLRTLTVGSRDVLDGYAADEICPSGRGQVLAPWPNRVEDGSYEYGGRAHQLALDQPDERNAIHGLVRWARWDVAEREPHRVALEHLVHPRPGYPFTLAMRIEYGLTERGLEVRTTATNVGPETCPYGTGAHPYFTVGTERVDSATLSVPAETVLRSDERGIPTGADPVDGTEYDFRRPRPIGATRLDHCFTGLTRDGDGRARIELRDPAGGGGLTVWVEEAYGYVMLFTGDPLPDVARSSLAIEPMTCPPNAFRTGTDLIHLDPGETHTAGWGVDAAP